MDLNRIKELAGTSAIPAPSTEATDRSSYVVEAMRIAGIPINEAYDDDEDPDVKIANADKRQREFEKKNSKALKAADKVAAKSDEKEEAAATKEASKDEDREEAPAEKKEEAPAAKPAATKGRKPSERGGSCRAWLAEHPNARLSEFVAHCKDLGMSKAHATTTFYSIKKKAKVAEAYMVFHPLDSQTVLAENTRMRRYEWIDINEGAPYAEPLIFESMFEAQSIVAGVGLMGQSGIVTKVMENDEPVEW